MSLLRFIARSLVASAFVADGVRKVTTPSEVSPQAERFASALTPVVQRVVPPAYSSHVPEKTETWVRICGAGEVVGGVMFATGLGRRLGALLLATASAFNVAAALPEPGSSVEEKKAQVPEVLTQVALLGATVLATQDLQGRPSIAWRRKRAERRRKIKQAVTS